MVIRLNWERNRTWFSYGWEEEATFWPMIKWNSVGISFWIFRYWVWFPW